MGPEFGLFRTISGQGEFWVSTKPTFLWSLPFVIYIFRKNLCLICNSFFGLYGLFSTISVSFGSDKLIQLFHHMYLIIFSKSDFVFFTIYKKKKQYSTTLTNPALDTVIYEKEKENDMMERRGHASHGK